MDASARQAVRLIHSSSTKAVIYITGGASKAITWLLSESGASNTVLQASVPYSRTAFTHVVSTTAAKSIKSFASIDAARVLARAAYINAVHLAHPGHRVVGISATCALVTLTPKRGDHCAFVVAHAADRVVEYTMKMAKGSRSRIEEDELSSLLVVQALLDDCGESLSSPSLHDNNNNNITKNIIQCNKTSHDQPLQNNNKNNLSPATFSMSISRESRMSLIRDHLVNGDILPAPVVHDFPDIVRSVIDGHAHFAECHGHVWNRDANRADLIFPGSFNPLHEGHMKLMSVAYSMYPESVCSFEISVHNADKAAIDQKEIVSRIAQFFPDDDETGCGTSVAIDDEVRRRPGVIISRKALFSEKAKLYGAVRFVVGIDTAARILNPKYYEPCGGLVRALTELKSAGCSFIVAGRLEQRKDGMKSTIFQTMANVEVPVGFEDMFEEIREEDFREDISSTELRARRNL